MKGNYSALDPRVPRQITHSVSGFCNLLEILQQVLVFHENIDRFSCQVQVVESLLQLRYDLQMNELKVQFLRLGFCGGNVPFQAAFSGEWNLLFHSIDASRRWMLAMSFGLPICSKLTVGPGNAEAAGIIYLDAAARHSPRI